MWFMAVYSKAWLLLWNTGSSLSLREEDSSLRSGSTRLRQLPYGMESISHRFTTPMDQWSTDFIARRNGREDECRHSLPQRCGCAAIGNRFDSRAPLIQSLTQGETNMSAAVMMERIAEASPRLKARIAGVFYLLTTLTRMFVEISVRNRLVVSDDAAATATNILAHEPLWRWGFAADIIAFASYVALTALFYELFKPVNRSVSLVAAFFSLVACGVQAVSSLFHLAPLVLLGGAPYLSVFT